eukprot:TRINITY_DN73335_c0_g1_i1.p1 TRINITY_DN73335_c0_g1~~TRINITY_DN73335_c0_g1_i1.p1  ORF type:complete len:248 (-),score=35.11 TRINITY_DN73335_c0_g1_i1:207-950(-)
MMTQPGKEFLDTMAALTSNRGGVIPTTSVGVMFSRLGIKLSAKEVRALCRVAADESGTGVNLSRLSEWIYPSNAAQRVTVDACSLDDPAGMKEKMMQNNFSTHGSIPQFEADSVVMSRRPSGFSSDLWMSNYSGAACSSARNGVALSTDPARLEEGEPATNLAGGSSPRMLSEKAFSSEPPPRTEQADRTELDSLISLLDDTEDSSDSSDSDDSEDFHCRRTLTLMELPALPELEYRPRRRERSKTI